MHRSNFVIVSGNLSQEYITGGIYENNKIKIFQGYKSVQCLFEMSEGKRPVERPKSRWKDNMKMGLKGIG
jgi:hypothetical protein